MAQDCKKENETNPCIRNGIKQDRHCTYNVTLRHVRVAIVTVEKKCVTYSECVVIALVIQHATHKHHIFLRGLHGSAM